MKCLTAIILLLVCLSCTQVPKNRGGGGVADVPAEWGRKDSSETNSRNNTEPQRPTPSVVIRYFFINTPESFELWRVELKPSLNYPSPLKNTANNFKVPTFHYYTTLHRTESWVHLRAPYVYYAGVLNLCVPDSCVVRLRRTWP